MTQYGDVWCVHLPMERKGRRGKHKLKILEAMKLIYNSRPELSRPLLNGKIHLPMHLPKGNGRIMRKRCRVCYSKTKKRVAVIYGCPDCLGFPGLCIECFREFHKY